MDEVRRLTRKPIPTSRKRWEREVQGVKKYLNELEELAQDLGTDWVQKQKIYYQARLEDLTNHEPARPIPDKRRTTRRSGTRNRSRGA